MPQVLICNTVEEDRQGKMEGVIGDAFLAVPELGLTPKHVSCSFLPNNYELEDDVPVKIIVDFLFEKPERTFEVRKRLSVEIWTRCKELAGNRGVEVYIRPFNQEEEAFTAD